MFVEPAKIISQLGLKEGDHVADLGAGSGHFTIAASLLVGSTGRVFAIEVQKDMVARLDNEAKRRSLANVTAVWGDIEVIKGTRLRDFSVDFIFLCNVMFQVKDKTGLLSEVKRILKPKGKILLIDWTGSFGQMGPSVENVFDSSKAESLFLESGFKKESSIEAGDQHYGLVFST